MSLVINFYFTSMLDMFWTLIHPSSGACDFSIVSPNWLCVLVSMCVGVSLWLGWSGICVAGSNSNCAFLLIVYVFSCAQKILEQTKPKETNVPTATKQLNTSHQAFASIRGVTGGTDQTSGGCSLCYTIPI